MNYTIPILMSSIFAIKTNNGIFIKENADKPSEKNTTLVSNNKPTSASTLSQVRNDRKSVVEFKNQKFCRVELEDFDFDAKFTIVGATVYFSGANFVAVQQRKITSSDLKPFADLQDKCKPGSIVIFEDIKVKAPDGEVRTIQGVSYTLY